MRCRSALLILTLLAGCTAKTPDKPTIETDKPAGVYRAGEKVTFTITADGYASLAYSLKRDGITEIAQGTIDLSTGKATVEGSLDAPGWLLLSVTLPTGTKKKPVTADGGAVFDWPTIAPAAAAPDDFDAFWKSQVAASEAVPLNARLTEVPSGNSSVAYYHFEADHTDGTTIRGQFAKPRREGKFPAMILLQYGGVYPLEKSWVVDRAAEGWMALNISAHDLPIDKPAAFYQEQAKGALKDYVAMGITRRETSYFRRMYVSCYRGATWLGEQPEWDGKTFVATGGSQGACQALATAVLYPKTSAVIASIPANCDTLSHTAGRPIGWPYWKSHADASADPAGGINASRYFDGTNFAERVTVPTLVSSGLIDRTCPPTAVLSMFNQLKGPKEIVLMPCADHKEVNGSHQPFRDRETAWRAELLKGNPAPVR